MFEKEYREIIELMKRNEDHAVMRTICENIIGILKDNGVKVDGTIVRHMTRTDTLTVVDDFEVKFNGLDFTEHDKKYVDEIKDLKKKISKLESELERSREYTETLRRMLGLRSAKENIELANKLYGLNFEVPDDEEPLPFSSDEYKEERIDKLEKRIGDLEACFNKKVERLEQQITLLKNPYYG